MSGTRLKDKWVMITGASGGFGAAAARAFGAEGSKLLLGARRVDRLKAVAAEARQAGAPEAHFHALDVSKTPNVDAFVAWARSRITEHRSSVISNQLSVTSHQSSGTSPQSLTTDHRSLITLPAPRLDVLINNAGGAHGLDTVAEGKDDDWETTLQTNVLGILRIPRPLRLELNGTGIRVTTVDPGLAETEFSVVRFKGDAARAKQAYEGTHPLVAEDIADILVWVASRPPHVNIDELLVKPVDQAAIHKVYRRTA